MRYLYMISWLYEELKVCRSKWDNNINSFLTWKQKENNILYICASISSTMYSRRDTGKGRWGFGESIINKKWHEHRRKLTVCFCFRDWWEHLDKWTLKDLFCKFTWILDLNLIYTSNTKTFFSTSFYMEIFSVVSV